MFEVVLRGQPISALGFKDVKGRWQQSAEDSTMTEAIAEQSAPAMGRGEAEGSLDEATHTTSDGHGKGEEVHRA